MHGRTLAENSLFLLIFAALALLAGLLFLGRIGNRGAARFHDGEAEFPPSRASLWSGLLIIAYLLETSIHHLLRRPGSVSDWLFQGLLFVGGLGLLFTLPGTIAVTDEGLEQRYWLRKRTRLAWDHIVEVKLDARTVTILGEDGTKIVHTGQQVDRPRLLVELKHHCGDELPPEFPNPPQKPD
jgi:hypothetical protein